MRRPVASAALVLCACVAMMPTGQAHAKKITLRVMYLPTRDAAVNPDQKAILAIADAYRAKHPDVELLPFEGLMVESIGQMDSGPLMAMAGGVAPEVLYVNFRQSETYISQGFLYPLDEYVEKWEREEDLSKLIPPQVWKVIRRKGPDGKEHVWSIPYGVVVMALQYRKDLFKKAGLDPNRPPRTWDELYDYCLRITEPEQGIYGIGLLTKTSAAWNFMSFLWSAGSDAVVEDPATGEWRAAYDDEGAVTAVEFYWKLRKGKWTKCEDDREPIVIKPGESGVRCPKCGRTYTVSGLRDKQRLYEGVVDTDAYGGMGWQRGKIGMMFQYLRDEYIAQVNPSQIGIAPVPKGPTGESHSEINATMYGINSTIKDPAVRDAAWDYIRYYASKEAKRIKTRTFIEAGFAKYVNPEWLREFGYEEYLREVPRGWAEVFKETIANSRPEPYGKNCQLIYIEMSRPLDKVAQMEAPSRGQIAELLKQEVAATNAKLLGKIPPPIRRQRNIITFFVVVGMAVAFTLLMRISLSHYSTQIRTQTSSARTQTVGYKQKRNVYAWLILLPALLLIGLWQYYPLVRGSLMAFQDYRIITGTTWVGLQNFSEALFSKDFWLTMYRTAWYAVLMLGLGFVTPIALALLLHEVPRGKVLFRTLYYLPAVTTGVVIYMLWKQFYDPSPHGFLNRVYGPASEIVRELMVLLVVGVAGGVSATFLGGRRREPDQIGWWMWPACLVIPLLVYRRTRGPRAERVWLWVSTLVGTLWGLFAVYVLVQGIRYTGLWVLLVAGALASVAVLLVTQRVAGSKLLYRTGAVVFSAAAVWVIAYGVRHVWPELFKADVQDFLNDADPIFNVPLLPAVAMVCVLLPQIWAGMGPGCIIYLAAMRAIPEEMYEAADLDGAGVWSKFWNVTVPFLKALIIINFVGAFIAAFRSFEPIFIMTGGGPAESTTVLGLDIWRNAYMYLKYGFAVSMAWILGSLLIGFTMMQLRILSRLEFRTASAKE